MANVKRCDNCGKEGGHFDLELEEDTGMSARSWIFCNRDCLALWSVKDQIAGKQFQMEYRWKLEKELFGKKKKKRHWWNFL